MVGGEVNPYPIQLLVNYWEMRPARMSRKFDELVRKGVNQVTAFVPWQCAEADISHALTRFLQAASEHRVRVQLILSPELGIHYGYSGFPKDLMGKREHQALDSKSQPISVALPPNVFALPSPFSPEFLKRYHGYLSRMDSLLADLGRTQPLVLEGVSLALTGSIWKYLRSFALSGRTPFGGPAGDYSSHATVAYRQALERFLAQAELQEPTPAAANRWRTRGFEEVNRLWFSQQSEEVFKARSEQILRRRTKDLPFASLELFTPEADPALTGSNFLQMLTGGHSDFARLSSMLDEMLARGSSSAPVVHWSVMGGFRFLQDSEKQFLILRSVLLAGSRGGGILIDEGDWFALSPKFRGKAEAIARSLAEGELSAENQALYLAPHLWSRPAALWSELLAKVGSGARLVASVESVLSERDAPLLIVDPNFVLTRESVQKISLWARAGRVVAVPRSFLYTESARHELERVIETTQKLEIDLGLRYQVHTLGEGKLVLYDLPEGGDASVSWKQFVGALLGVANVEPYCQVADGRLSVVPLRRRQDDLALFVLNPFRRTVSADIWFPSEVRVSDLAQGLPQQHEAATSSLTVGEVDFTDIAPPATRFSLDVPAHGILPLGIRGGGGDAQWLSGGSDRRESWIAAAEAERTRQNAALVAKEQLPGLAEMDGSEAEWS